MTLIKTPDYKKGGPQPKPQERAASAVNAVVMPAFTPDSIDLFRQWFDAVQDLNPSYLDATDYALPKQLYEALDMRVPDSIKHKLLIAALEEPPSADMRIRNILPGNLD